MSFDKDKIRDMEYDPSRGRYVGKDGSELRSTPFSDGTGYKYDYYSSTTYNNENHDSTHVKSDLSENWERTDNNRKNGTQQKSSGNGCYLTTACMKFYSNNFDDNCYELTMMRWLRDNIVSDSDKLLYYLLAPEIVENINSNTEEKKAIIYSYIYENVLIPCISLIEEGNYKDAYDIYKNSFMCLTQSFTALPKSSGLKLKKYTF